MAARGGRPHCSVSDMADRLLSYKCPKQNDTMEKDTAVITHVFIHTPLLLGWNSPEAA